MIFEENNLPARFTRTIEMAFVFDAARQYPKYPQPYILCQKWEDTNVADNIWVKVPVIDPPSTQ